MLIITKSREANSPSFDPQSNKYAFEDLLSSELFSQHHSTQAPAGTQSYAKTNLCEVDTKTEEHYFFPGQISCDIIKVDEQDHVFLVHEDVHC